jgi:hypothetical protein
MIKNLKISTIIIAAFLLFAINNFINILIAGRPILDYIKYVGIILIGLLGLVIIIKIFVKKKYKAYAIAFFIFGIVTTYLGDQGNATGVYFICLSLYMFNSEKFNIFVISSIMLTIIVKSYVYYFTIFQASNLFLFYGIALLLFFKILHPNKYNKIRIGKIDTVTYDIIDLLIKGHTKIEISKMHIGDDKKQRSINAINKRIEKLKLNNNCKNVFQLVYNLAEKSLFRL